MQAGVLLGGGQSSRVRGAAGDDGESSAEDDDYEQYDYEQYASPVKNSPLRPFNNGCPGPSKPGPLSFLSSILSGEVRDPSSGSSSSLFLPASNLNSGQFLC